MTDYDAGRQDGVAWAMRQHRGSLARLQGDLADHKRILNEIGKRVERLQSEANHSIRTRTRSGAFGEVLAILDEYGRGGQ